MSLVTEMIAELLEKAQRPGLLGVVGKAVQKQCTKDLAGYFAHIGKRVKEMKFEELADPDRAIKVDHARHAVQMRMHNLLRGRQHFLRTILETNIAAAIDAANKVQLLAEADDDDTNLDFTVTDKVGMTAEEAAAYASAHAGDLVAGLDATTQSAISDAVATGIEDQLGVAGTAQLIKSAVDTMSTSRAQMIASTEMNDAMSQAFLRKLQINSVQYKQWILGPDPCEVCEDNADASPIPVDEDFPSGDDAPPAHPNCVCAVAGARAPSFF